jgi:hypothetical protein
MNGVRIRLFWDEFEEIARFEANSRAVAFFALKIEARRQLQQVVGL